MGAILRKALVMRGAAGARSGSVTISWLFVYSEPCIALG